MSIFKAYDVRGLVDSEITADFCFATGVAFARFLQQEREPGTVVIGEDLHGVSDNTVVIGENLHASSPSPLSQDGHDWNCDGHYLHQQHQGS